MFPGIQRNSDEWVSLYKIRTVVERSINHFKTNICVAGEKDPESCHYESGCIPRWDCQPVYRDRLPPHELSTIYQKPQTVNRLKKILSFHILAQAY